MSTLADVAKLAGVSKSTASRALSGKGSVSPSTRMRVSSVAEQLEFVPSINAKSLATGMSRNVALITPCINRWFYGEVIDGVESALIVANYDLRLYRLSESQEQRRALFEYFLMRKGVDAVIAVSLLLNDREVAVLNRLGKPVVGIGGQIPGITTFSIDDVKTAKRATQHLIELGHTRIVHFGGDQNRQLDFDVHSKRLEGFRQALDTAGLSHANDFFPDDFDFSGGYRSAMRAFENPKVSPTAIVAGSDEIAIGAISAIQRLGMRIPDDVSIIGIDGHPFGEALNLTTMDQFPSRQGSIAVSEVLGQIGRSLDSVETLDVGLDVKMRIRNSTACA